MSHPLPPPMLYSRPTTPTPPSPAPISTSSRATTAPVKSKHHIPHHPHRLHHHHHHHRVPHSAIQPSTSNSFPDTQSPISRISTRNEELEQERGREMRAKEEAEKEKEVWKAVEKKREERMRVDEHLGQTLQSLTKLSTTTTRRLDYTYYSTLEHLSVLANLTSSLATLSSTISQHQVHFSNSTSSLAQIFRTQISGFDKTFRVQAERISALETRLQEGRTRVGNLNQRLESVRVRVEGWERGEMEWQGRARRRLRMLWAGTGSMLAIFLVFLLIRHWPQGGREVAPPLTLQPPASDTTSPSLHVDDEVKNPAVASFPTTSFESRGGFSPGTSPPPHIARMSSSAIVIRKNVDYDYDALLRLFDEL